MENNTSRRSAKPRRISISLFILSIFLGFQIAAAQRSEHIPSDNRGDPLFRRRSNLDGNNVRVTVHNYGFCGSIGSEPDQWEFEWPKNTNREHINLLAIWLAGEVVDEEGETIQIVDFPTFRQNPAGESWNLEPVPGFLNPDGEEIARSDVPDTWPRAEDGGWRDKRDDSIDPGWVGSWNGFFGKNEFNADQEMFYRCSDDLYDRFNYIPDSTDPTRGGLGLLMDVRSFSWSDILIKDIVFFINDIKNDGTKRIPKSVFLIWLADLVGGDANDDQPFVDLQTNIAFLTDADRIGTDPWGDDPVGLGAVKFLETPGNQVDGIDNDGDADDHDLLLMNFENYEERIPTFTEEDFEPRTIAPGSKIVLIDSLTFERRIVSYPVGGGTVVSLGQSIELPAGGITLEEDTLANSLDEDLDGLIDERLTLHLERFDEISGTVEAVRYINYLYFDTGDTVKRGFLVSGKSAPMNYTTVAPMIDESRDDGFDNDGDWNSRNDDVGLDGIGPDNDKYIGADTGEGDGLPTSGTGTDFPGETNLDKTDVSETDLIGITGALQDPAFNINFQTISDRRIWRNFMTPGYFYIPRLTGEYDTYVSAGYFPIEPGERQRMAVSVAMAGDGATKSADIQSAIRKQEQARKAYETDYRFAQAPLQPTLTAVPGDGKVTLYWDDVAEFSVDNYIKRIDPYRANDFEGYRIYRATDAAFLDAKVITDGQGIPLFLRPIVQFDKRDGITGYHQVDIEGTKFYLGDDTGLQHSYVDSGLVNGQRYFYAVTAYDFGYESGGFAPNESFIRVDVDTRGNITTGQNVAVIRPRAPVAGYMPAEVTGFTHAQGSSTGQIGFDIVDPRVINEGHEYQLTFRDTLIVGEVIDILTTKTAKLVDLTDSETLFENLNMYNPPLDFEMPLTEGFRLILENEDRIEVDAVNSTWNDPLVFDYQFSVVSFLTISGDQAPYDYQIIIGEDAMRTSKDTSISFVQLPSQDVNFKVMNISRTTEVEFAFAELHGTDGRFTIDPDDANFTDVIMLLEPGISGKLKWTWQIILNNQPTGGRNPQAGDTLTVILRKPFLSSDVYRFTMMGESEDRDLANEELDDIRVVPNPYVAAETWEPRNTYASGRGPREIHFINLPQQCTIRIFNVNGVLVDEIEHDTTLDNGTAIWDMLSRDNLEIAYGVYVYHIEAPGIGEKTGTFAIIK